MTQRYDTYKDSGVQWLGEIPGHWGCVFINRLFNIKAGGDVKPELYADKKDENHPFPVYTNTKSADDVYAYTSLATCPSNSITVTGRGEVGHAIFRETPYDAIVRLLSLTPKSNIICKFYAYFIDTVIPFSSDSAAIGQLSAVQIKQKHVTLPPLSEQRSIVSFLDAKCGKIDEWVIKKQKEVEHLQELKQRVIADAVTRGLNPHVKMKATNIPWIKEIPEHWERNKVLRLFKQIGSGTTPSSGDASLYADEGTPWLQSGDFNNNEINSTSKFLTDKALDNYSLKLYNSGGVVIAMYGASIGKVGLLNIATTVNQACCVLSDSDHLLQKFSFYVFINEKDNLVKKSKGGTQPNISQEIIKSHYIPVPPLSEQRSIVSYLDAKCSKIDKLIANITKEIECIKEYKQRLISDVVTGQIKVC